MGFLTFSISGAPKGPRNDCLQAHPGVVARKSEKSEKSYDFDGILTFTGNCRNPDFFEEKYRILTFGHPETRRGVHLAGSNDFLLLLQPQKHKKL